MALPSKRCSLEGGLRCGKWGDLMALLGWALEKQRGGGRAKRRSQGQRSMKGHCRRGEQRGPRGRRASPPPPCSTGAQRQGGRWRRGRAWRAGCRGGLSLEGGGATEGVRQLMAGRGDRYPTLACEGGLGSIPAEQGQGLSLPAQILRAETFLGGDERSREWEDEKA